MSHFAAGFIPRVMVDIVEIVITRLLIDGQTAGAFPPPTTTAVAAAASVTAMMAKVEAETNDLIT